MARSPLFQQFSQTIRLAPIASSLRQDVSEWTARARVHSDHRTVRRSLRGFRKD
ncbi:MAG TPA: hypothetical protein VKE51_04595 [Vicinamibacterales bacterium]|nr:hypothetical protein [Vicinamibacterales bacterium]